MKYKRLIMTLLSVLLLSSCSAVTSTKSKLKVNTFVERCVPLYMGGLNTNESNKSNFETSLSGTFSYYQINDSNIPFVELNEFTNQMCDYSSIGKQYFNLQMKYEDNKAVFFTEAGDGTLTIDFDNSIATYYHMNKLLSLSKAEHDYQNLIFGNQYVPENYITYDYYEGNDYYEIDLSKYDIKRYFYKGKGYLPYNVCSILLSSAPIITNTIAYAKDFVFSNVGNTTETTKAINEYIKQKTNFDWVDEEYLLESYNELALFLDTYMGLDERNSHINNTKIKYLENGAYETLKKYKDRLISKEQNVSNNALIELFSNELDDGGHDKFIGMNYFSDRIFERKDVSGAETLQTLDTIDKINDLRKEKEIDIDTVTGKEKQNGYYKEYDDVAYIQFNSFESTTNAYSESMITDDNYSQDSISLFHYANRKIKSNPNIKDVIIDLSANSGGAVFASDFISSWICGGATTAIRDVKSNSFMKYTVRADVDFDGIFTPNDYLNDNINVYVIISQGSFSCGNRLPCEIKDNRTNNTYFIGSNSGGGSCTIQEGNFNWLGTTIRVSSRFQLGRVTSTQDNFVSVESGVEADFLKFNNTDYDKFADIPSIISKVVENRKTK